MKKPLYILLLFLSNLAVCQEYTPLLDTYNQWSVRYCFSGCSTDVYYTNGDTIVDAMNYKVLDGFHFISRGFLLREDVTEKKVYLKTILPSGIRDYLLYDFSLEVGDSINIKNPASPFLEDAGYYKVDAITLLPLVDSNLYRHFYLSPAASNTISENDAIWVEGVGSLSLINAPGGDPDVHSAGRVACMFKDGVSFYADLNIIEDCEDIILDKPSIQSTINNCKIISSPIVNEFSVINIKPFTSLDVYNLNGQLLQQFNVNYQNTLALNLSSYKPAMYLIVLKSQDTTHQVLKVLVQ